MSTAMSNALTLPSYAASRHQPALASPPCMSLQSQTRFSRTLTYSGKVSRSVVVMAAGDVPTATATETEPETTAETVTATTVTTPPETAEETGETPELLKTVQDTWDKVEDKYAVSSLAAAATLALIASSGVISAVDRLPLIPGVLELVGIGYSGWFAYKNLLFTPEREALIEKVKNTYKDVTGSN